MKMKEIRSRGACIPGAPLDPPMTFHNQIQCREAPFRPVYHVEKLCPFISPLAYMGMFTGNLRHFSEIPYYPVNSP